MTAPRARIAVLACLALALAALPAALAGKARSPQQGTACSGSDPATCVAEAAAARAPVQPETYLVQYHAGLQQRASVSPVFASDGMDGQVAAEGIRETFNDVLKVGNAIKGGFDAVGSAVPLFVDGKIAAGLATFADGLLEAVIHILPSNVTGSTRFADFRQNWAQVTDKLPDVVENARSGVALYKESGDVSGLLRVCLDVINSYAPFVMQFLPAEVSMEVAKFLGAVEDAIEGYSEAVEIYFAGNTSDAIVHIYSGVRMVISELVPEEWQSNEKIMVAVGVMDAAIGNLTSIVLRVHQRFVEAGACWKVYSSRERVRPEQCPEGHWYDGLHWCFPQGAEPPKQIKNADGICLRSRRGTIASMGFDQLEMAECDRSDFNQQWFFNSKGGHIRSNNNGCLNVRDSESVGGDVLLRKCKEDKIGQDWEYSEKDGSIKVKGGLCLDPVTRPRRPRGFTRFQLYTCDAARESQQWSVVSYMDEEEAAALLDTSIARKTKATTMMETVMATCDETSAFADQAGPWCYKACPEGSEGAGRRCRTTCKGEFPTNAPLMCGKSYKALAGAYQEIAAKTFMMGKNTKAMRASLGLAGGLSQTMEVMLELGMSATHPLCE